MLSTPYVTTAEFKAHPTFLDVMNLRSGDVSAGDQDDELYNILLMASAWADGFVAMGAGADPGAGSLAAHTRVERARVRVARDGRISYHPDHNPVTALVQLQMGPAPNQLSTVPDLTGLWIEGQEQIVGYPGGAAAPGLAALQFGTPAAGSELYTQWTYTAGYANSLLGASALAGASTLTVADTTGIAAGTVLRIWDPGNEEAVTVAPSYTTGAVLPLLSPLRFAHTNAVPTGVSGLPADAHLAVILYAVALLQRPDSDAEDNFPATTMQPNTRADTSKGGSGFVNEAEKILQSYWRVR